MNTFNPSFGHKYLYLELSSFNDNISIDELFNSIGIPISNIKYSIRNKARYITLECKEEDAIKIWESKLFGQMEIKSIIYQI